MIKITLKGTIQEARKRANDLDITISNNWKHKVLHVYEEDGEEVEDEEGEVVECAAVLDNSQLEKVAKWFGSQPPHEEPKPGDILTFEVNDACICEYCHGEGKSSRHLGAFSREDVDDDFMTSYMRGDYDQQCAQCGGTGHQTPEQQKEYRQRISDLRVQWQESGRPEGSFENWAGL